MTDHILTINAGSSSTKFGVFASEPGTSGELPALLRGKIDGAGKSAQLSAVDAEGKRIAPPAAGAGVAHPLETLMRWLDMQIGAGSLAAAGHRVAFGGLDFAAPTRVTAAVLAKLRALVPFAPLHQPANVQPIEWLAEHHPHLLQVACFDSAFHRTMPELAQRYGLPAELHAAGARRYGFHGLSYEYIAGRLEQLDPPAAAGRTIIAHLGSGASLCALRAGASVATTMGFSALSGVMMATRPGELDPGVVIWLLRERGISLAETEALLYHDCGLKGVSGHSGDMRALLASADPKAREAIALFVDRIVREIGSLAAALGGLDALVFTAGIGENAAPIRAAVARGCVWLGAVLDDGANDRPDFGRQRAAMISAKASRLRLWVIPTDEEQIIARHSRRLIRAASQPTRSQQ
jgi:acetate kinase